MKNPVVAFIVGIVLSALGTMPWMIVAASGQ